MAAPEAVAAEVLAAVPPYLWDGRSLPVPVEDIVDSQFGLQVCETADLAAIAGAPAGVTLSGLLVVDDRQIWVNAAEAEASPGRRRFTLGHELGHWCLHRSREHRIFCRAAEAGAGIDIEDEASAFAGALLFPAGRVRAEWDGDLEAMRERFGASRIATRRAVFRHVYEPDVRERSPGLTCFFFDDPGYEGYRDRHGDRFVVNDALGDPAAARLHRLSCSHLARPAGATPRTAHPKWVSADLDELRRTFAHAAPCTRCVPA